MAIPDIESNPKLAKAVAALERNCGPIAREVLLESGRQIPSEHICRLARTSPERQRYRMEGVAAGRLRSINPCSADHVFDTVSFGEVVSRLRRARGNLKRSLDLLSERGPHVLSSDRIGSLALEIEKCLQLLPRLQRAIAHLPEGEDVIKRYRSKQSTKTPTSTIRDVVKMIPGARSFLEKNVKDVESVLAEDCSLRIEDATPTQTERRDTERELAEIELAIDGLNQLLSERS